MADRRKGWRLNNCLLFAVLEAIRNDKYIVIRKTRRNYRWPCCRYHFLVVPKSIIDEFAESYLPEAETLGDWPCPLFKGVIKKGDK